MALIAVDMFCRCVRWLDIKDTDLVCVSKAPSTTACSNGNKN